MHSRTKILPLPLLVIVSGAPGSGKTTFAGKLADHMRLLHLERDVFFNSLEYTIGKKIDRQAVGVPRFYEVVTQVLAAGASLIIDSTLYKGISEEAIIELQAIADIVNIHCRAVNTHERFY
ncbi:MAG TPA: AAA family ATPase, partial [Patescibacteria group bacterium]|nr:AAA family ATPase [Patescibacteria group bacterium]